MIETTILQHKECEHLDDSVAHALVHKASPERSFLSLAAAHSLLCLLAEWPLVERGSAAVRCTRVPFGRRATNSTRPAGSRTSTLLSSIPPFFASLFPSRFLHSHPNPSNPSVTSQYIHYFILTLLVFAPIQSVPKKHSPT